MSAVEIAQGVDGVRVLRDLRSGTWTLLGDGVDYRLRPWTWGERRRLLSACTHRGKLDTLQFLKSFVEFVYTPVPPDESRRLYAYIALRLLGVSPQSPRRRIIQAEALLAQRFGWTPAHLESEPAAELDRLLDCAWEQGEKRVGERSHSVSPTSLGKHSLVIVDDSAPTPPTSQDAVPSPGGVRG